MTQNTLRHETSSSASHFSIASKQPHNITLKSTTTSSSSSTVLNLSARHTMDDEPSKQNQQSYWDAIVSNRSHATSLQSDGTIGHNLFEKMATLNINYRINEERHHRCPVCWYCNVRCVCDLMPSNIGKEDLPNVKILLLMHHKEYLNAGNSAKNLIALLPEENIDLYVYGKEGDFDRCLDEMMMDQGRQTAILWPGENAISVEEFISSSCPPTQSKNPKMMESGRSDDDEVTDKKYETEEEKKMLRIVALDGTYKNAKNMHKTIRKRLNEDNHTMPACIALHPKSFSQFHRAHKNYGAIQKNLKANEKLDERALRVSTAEACALLLTELGAKESVQEKIIKALLVNNCDRGVT
jgi:DTW domain-containing protein YfiP